MQPAVLLLVIAGVYAAIGLAFAVAFTTWGIGRIDPAAHDAPIGFRLLILPGSAALWPVMAVKWIMARGRGGEP